MSLHEENKPCNAKVLAWSEGCFNDIAIPTDTPLWAWVLLGLFLFFLIFCTADQMTSQKTILLSALLATAGWVTTTRLSMINTRKQHTFNTLLQLRHSTIYNDHVETIRRHLKGTISNIPATAYDNTDLIKQPSETTTKITQGQQLKSAVQYVANHFEFIAVGIFSKDLDHDILRQFIRGTACSVFIIANDFMALQRKELQQNGCFAGTNPTSLAYEHFIKLFGLWANDDEKRLATHWASSP